MSNYVPTGWQVEASETSAPSPFASFFRGQIRLRSYRTGEVLVLRFSCITLSRTLEAERIPAALGPLGVELQPEQGTIRNIGDVEVKEYHCFSYNMFPTAAHVLTFGTSSNFAGNLEGFDVRGGGMTMILFRNLALSGNYGVTARLRLPALGSKPLPGFVLSCGLANVSVDYNESVLFFGRTGS